MRWVVPVFGLNPKTCGQMAGFHSGHMASPNVRRRAHRCRCRASVQGVWHPPKWRPPRRSSPPRNACTAGGGLRWRRFRKFRAPGRPRPQDSGPGRFYDRELTWQVGESKATETSAFQLAPTGTLPTLMGGHVIAPALRALHAPAATALSPLRYVGGGLSEVYDNPM